MKKKIFIIGILAAVIVFGLYVGIQLGIPKNPPAKKYLAQNTPTINSLIGKKAPEFTLLRLDGETVNLADYLGKNVVLFFSEGSMCYPSCWNQIAALKNDARLNSKDTVSFSIVVDSKSQWQKISQKAPEFADAPILFDTDRSVSSAYGVLTLPSSMHKGSYPGHTYIILDKKGIVRFTFDDPQMALRNDLLTGELQKLS